MTFSDILADVPEPNVFSLLGHCFGKHAPGRSSDRRISPEGDSQLEPYIVGHNLLLSHASAVKVFREMYGETDKQIGLVVNMNWGGMFYYLNEQWGS
jgi:beta-glucosidase